MRAWSVGVFFFGGEEDRDSLISSLLFGLDENEDSFLFDGEKMGKEEGKKKNWSGLQVWQVLLECGKEKEEVVGRY